MDSPGIISIVLRILALLVLVLLNAFFVASEFALVKVRDTQLSPLALRGNRRARVARFILQRLDAFLNRSRVHKLHLLTSVLWLRGRKIAGVRRLAAPGLASSSGERLRDLPDRPPRHP